MHLRDNMRRLGIPVDWVAGNFDQLYTKVMIDGDFHIYTGGQFTWRFPVVLGFLGFQVMLQMLAPQPIELSPMSGWRDYIGGLQEGKIQQYLDEARDSWESRTFTESLAHSSNAQGAYVEDVLGIPLWSTYSYHAYRKELLGVVNMAGQGIINQYTLMHAYKEDGSPIRIGLIDSPTQMNIMESRWFTDYQVLDTIYNDAINFAPYDLSSDQPWIVQDWNLKDWINPETGKENSVVDYWFRKDVYMAKPQTGDEGPRLTADDYEFTCHYIYAQGYEGCLYIPHWGRFKDIYNVTIVDPFHVRVFMNISSYWAPNGPTYPILSKSMWLREPLANQRNAYFEKNVNITLPGNVTLDKRVVSGSADTNIEVQLTDNSYRTLVWGSDYTWTEGNLVIKVDSIEGVPIDKVWVDYWTYGNTGGYFPGDLPWNEILGGYGPYYVTSFTYGIGGHISLKRNPFFFLETPLMGEVDWNWKWSGGTKPRSGCYKINIYDLTLVAGAYGSQATSVPSSNWFAGADLAPEGGKIDLFDIVTVSSKYGQEFGHPPP